jgi:hypothetical protein
MSEQGISRDRHASIWDMSSVAVIAIAIAALLAVVVGLFLWVRTRRSRHDGLAWQYRSNCGSEPGVVD